MTKMWAAVMCMAIALDMKKDAILTDDLAARGSSGMRESSSAEKTKAQGRCGTDAVTCSDGEVVHRDPANTCRFASCGTSLVQESSEQPTYSWTGVSIDENQNFCTRMTSLLGDSHDLAVTSCTGQADCADHYVHLLDGKVGDIQHCRAEGTACVAGAIHNCTWSFYMADLIRKHNTSEDNCAAKLLEAKRSLDGLLHSVQDVYNQLMQWNAIVQAENGTIRGLLQEQQADWDEYVSNQANCDSLYSGDHTQLQEIEAEMTELRAIANPDVRSAVDVRGARGYQSSGTTSESCPAAYPFVSSSAGKKYMCCLHSDDATDSASCTERNCTDEGDHPVDCVNNAKANGDGLLAPSQTAAEAAAAFAEIDESACQTFSSFVERVQKKHGVTLVQADPCHEQRAALAVLFKDSFLELAKLYNEIITLERENRTICLNEATYHYKAGVEGLDGIDDRIQDAAGKIHEAQGEIARLEPMLHDVERAVDRMRAYVGTIAGECVDEGTLGKYYLEISEKIKALQECPGRNDFIINVPHWAPQTPTTPSPTPWYDSPDAAAVKSQL